MVLADLAFAGIDKGMVKAECNILVHCIQPDGSAAKAVEASPTASRPARAVLCNLLLRFMRVSSLSVDCFDGWRSRFRVSRAPSGWSCIRRLEGGYWGARYCFQDSAWPCIIARMKKPFALLVILFVVAIVTFGTWQLYSGNLEAAFSTMPFLLVTYLLVKSQSRRE